MNVLFPVRFHGYAVRIIAKFENVIKFAHKNNHNSLVIMRYIICPILFSLLCVAPAYSQKADSLAHPVDSMTVVPADSVKTDSTENVIDNSHTVELIKQSQTEDLTSSVRESLLVEQLENLNDNDIRQRRAVQQQLERLKISDSIRRVEQQQYIDSLKQHASGAPVTLKSDTLYYVYTNLGSFTPNERAQLNSEKILRTAKIYAIKSDSLSIADNNSTSDIMYNDLIIASITDTDALWMNSTRQQLAEKYKQSIVEAITQYKKDISLLNILKIIGLCLLVIVGFVVAVKSVSYLFRRIIDKKISAKKGKRFKGIKIKTFEVMDQEREVKAILGVSKIVRYILYVVLFYLAILLLFSVFPPTQRLAETLFGWIWGPLASMMKGFVKYLPNLFKIVIIVIVFRYVVKFCAYVTREISTGRLVVPGFFADWAKATFNIVRIFLYAFMLVLIFPYLPGADTGTFQGVSVFIGILFTLGSTSVISNLMAGMVITYMRPFRIGDRIKIGEVAGDVVEKSPFVIRIKTVKNEVVTVPNSTVLSANVINYSSTSAPEDTGLIIHTEVTMSYDTPWRQVNQLLIDAALKTDSIQDKPQPFVLQTSLNDFSASYQLCAYIKEPGKQALIYSALHQNIQDAFFAAGIEMLTPHYRAVRDGNKSTIPNKPTAEQVDSKIE